LLPWRLLVPARWRPPQLRRGIPPVAALREPRPGSGRDHRRTYHTRDEASGGRNDQETRWHRRVSRERPAVPTGV